MGKIRDGLFPEAVKSFGARGLDLALQYIESADPRDLAAIRKANFSRQWLAYIVFAMNKPPRLDEEDLRVLHVLAAQQDYENLGVLFSDAVKAESVDSFLGVLHAELKRVNLPADEVISTLVAFHDRFQEKGQPNAAGRYVLSLSDQQLEQLIRTSQRKYFSRDFDFLGLVDFLFAVAPDRLDVIAPLILEPGRLSAPICERMLRKRGKQFEPMIAAAWKSVPEAGTRFGIAKLLVAHDPERYKARALELCRELLDPTRKETVNGGEIFEMAGLDVRRGGTGRCVPLSRAVGHSAVHAGNGSECRQEVAGKGGDTRHARGPTERRPKSSTDCTGPPDQPGRQQPGRGDPGRTGSGD